MPGAYIIIIILGVAIPIWGGSIVACYFITEKKNLAPINIVFALLGPIGILIVWLKKGDMLNCPKCGCVYEKKSKRCPKCNYKIEITLYDDNNQPINDNKE